MPLVLMVLNEETPKEAMLRYASRYGLEKEVTSIFEQEVLGGASELDAAFIALGEWDCLDYIEE
jgi:hypothetical protein